MTALLSEMDVNGPGMTKAAGRARGLTCGFLWWAGAGSNRRPSTFQALPGGQDSSIRRVSRSRERSLARGRCSLTVPVAVGGAGDPRRMTRTQQSWASAPCFVAPRARGNTVQLK